MITLGGQNICVIEIGSYLLTDKDEHPSISYPNTVWEDVTGVILGGIDTKDTDTNIKTSFNQKTGTIIGHKLLHSHGHAWLGVNDGTTVTSKVGVYPFRIYQDKVNNWNGSASMIRNAGGGNAENIQPTRLTHIYLRLK